MNATSNPRAVILAAGRLALASLLLCLASGCEIYNVRYTALTKNTLTPVAHASAIDGTVDLISLKRLFEERKLPSTTARKRIDLAFQWSDLYSAQLESPDYVYIGEVLGGGNNRVNFNMLDAAICKEAAAHGGDVVLVLNRQVQGQSYNSSFASANKEGATAFSVSGTNAVPAENGEVFKYVPGFGQEREARRQIYKQLPDTELARLEVQIGSIEGDNKLTFEQAQTQISALLRAAAVSKNPAPATEESTPPAGPPK